MTAEEPQDEDTADLSRCSPRTMQLQDKYIYVYCESKYGFSNRLIMLNLALIMGKQTQTRVLINWTDSRHCPGSFHSVLKLPRFHGAHAGLNLEPKAAALRRKCDDQCIMFLNCFEKRETFLRHWKYAYDNHLGEDSWPSVLPTLQDKVEFQESIRAFAETYLLQHSLDRTSAVGFHCRRGDWFQWKLDKVMQQLDGSESRAQEWKRREDELIWAGVSEQLRRGMRVIFCTDDPSYREECRQRFAQEMKDRVVLFVHDDSKWECPSRTEINKGSRATSVQTFAEEIQVLLGAKHVFFYGDSTLAHVFEDWHICDRGGPSISREGFRFYDHDPLSEKTKMVISRSVASVHQHVSAKQACGLSDSSKEMRRSDS
eukprot:TRINITY_DN80718_c0_g1_i1.p1 TRINITY_DN80718_c0_g1~~TRINITY_DN80718_c0_g1_i1.p1  ORF type:complete len:372 (+),score=54.44 TRINITY_DN80718_c0_g1_i1:160-1275(+)